MAESHLFPSTVPAIMPVLTIRWVNMAEPVKGSISLGAHRLCEFTCPTEREADLLVGAIRVLSQAAFDTSATCTEVQS